MKKVYRVEADTPLAKVLWGNKEAQEQLSQLIEQIKKEALDFGFKSALADKML